MKRLLLAAALLAIPAFAQEHAAPAAGHGEAAAAHGEDANLGFWKWLNFGILFLGIAYAVGKNAGPFFNERIAEIQKDINEAKKIKADAEARASAIEKRLANLDAELAAIRTDAKREMAAEAVRIQDETKRLIARAGEQSAQEIATMSKAAENSLRIEAGRLAIALAEKKLKARMSPEAESSLAARFVAGLRQTVQN